MWDGDWLNEKGWTGRLIEPFLSLSTKNRAVAFQKKKEVPGFHRQYCSLYQKFPGQIWMVVLDDQPPHIVPPKIQEQKKWLETMYEGGKVLKPSNWTIGQDSTYLEVALLARQLQGMAPVVAINGGKIATAQC